jgi:hypothetical protein
MNLTQPAVGNGDFKIEAFLAGDKFVYGNSASGDTILYCVRMAASLLTVLLGLLIFFAGREMFNATAGLLALTLFVFDPNILAHGAYVTTDIGLSCFLLATVYGFYRYLKSPSWARLLLTGAAAGCALAAKHSGVLLFPILLLLAIAEVIRGRDRIEVSAPTKDSRLRRALRYVGALVCIKLVAVGILWAFYGFRYAARPDGLSLNPPLAEYVQGLHHPFEIWIISLFARWHLLPESYLYGLTDVRLIADFMSTGLLGRVYPHGKWFYFPIAFVIKTPLLLMLLLAVALFFIVRGRLGRSRELLFLTIPPAVYLTVAMSTGLNIGLRHTLPAYPYIFILSGAAAAALIAQNRRWAYVLAVLFVLHLVSLAHSRNAYLAYSNELWGGPSQTYQYLTDSNVDWGQQLPSVKAYIDQHHVGECWFAYFASVAHPSAYGIPCHDLPTTGSMWLHHEFEVPPAIDGTVFISAGVLSGFELGPDELNPYDLFQHLKPVAVIDDGVFVYEGHFEVPLASAINHITRSQIFADRGQMNAALAEAQTAAKLAPKSARVEAALAKLLVKMNKPAEARGAYQSAIMDAETVEPVFQADMLKDLEKSLRSLN